MARRVAFAAVAIPSVIGIAYLGSWALAALLAVAAALGARELYAFARLQGIEPLERLGMLAAAATPLAVALTLFKPGFLAELIKGGYALVGLVLLVMGAALLRRGPDARPLAVVAVTLFGVLYAAWLPSFAMHLRHPLPAPFLDDSAIGMALLFYPLVLTWVGDSAAMTGGKAFGGAKMAPVVSPNKTWAGGWSGLFGTVAVSVIYAATIFQRAGIAMSVVQAIGCGIVISVVGQAGDVIESLFKREVSVKDSSALLPGHGGVLDRLDSLYVVLPVTALLYQLVDIT